MCPTRYDPVLTMAGSQPQLDVLIMGEHPAAYLCAALLKHKSKLKVLHSTIPQENWPDRLVIVNPELFNLHPLLEPLRKKIEATGVYGVRFLSDAPPVASEHRSRSTVACVASYKAVRAAAQRLAEGQDLEMVAPNALEIHRVDEAGVEVTVGKAPFKPRVLVLAGMPAPAHQRILGMPVSWDANVLHRYTFVKLPGTKWTQPDQRPLIPMSLNLREMLCWGWLLPGERMMQLAVVQPIESLGQVKPLDLLAHWIEVLRAHGQLLCKNPVPLDNAQSIDLPLAGALAHEGVASRTLLIGPAGGFYSATGEDIYPNCWSALFAADVIKKALKEVHLQDALQPYRQKWRTTLGSYLRGPQQNLRFLLPLVYRNQVMTTRLTESILLGKSVVR